MKPDSMHGMSGRSWVYAYVDNEIDNDDMWSINKIDETGDLYCSKSPTEEVDAWFEQQELLKEVKQATPTTTKTRSL